MSEETRLCPRCGKTISVTSAAFCPFCGEKVLPRTETPPEIQSLLQKYKTLTDPKLKLGFLENALALYPDSLELNEERLFLGRLAERNPRAVDFSVIKSYLLNLYLTPEKFSPEKKGEMRRELWDHPHLNRCLEVAPDRESFLDRYALRLCSEFIYLFLEGSSTYNRSFLGFHIGGKKNLARPAALVMAGLYRDEELPQEHRQRFYRAMGQAFRQRTGEEEALKEWLLGVGLPAVEG